MDPKEFALLLERFALSAEGYRKVRKGVQKRIVRHMQELGCSTARAYLARLDRDGNAERDARRLMDVSISRFFRDGEVWQALETEILPPLIAKRPAGLRIWSAGCALGQEVYSFRILWALLSDKVPFVPPLDLQATDVNPSSLQRAMEGVYPARALDRVPAEARARFFRPVGERSCLVVEELRKGIRWQVHDLTADPPLAGDFHVVFLRNGLLTYYRKEIVEAALSAVSGSLAPGGSLVIGRKERLPASLDGFDSHPSVPCLYRKRQTGGLA